MATTFTQLDPGSVILLPGIFLDRFKLNRRYVASLQNEYLLQNHMLEAGLWQAQLHETRRIRNDDPGQACRDLEIHWGWESPSCQLRGHFLGHWLSAAARIFAATGDEEVHAKAEQVVRGLERCQEANGGEWVASIPTLYLDRIARGQDVWAPHYTIHKTLMGLWDMYLYAGSAPALEILLRTARWFHRWTGGFTRDQLDEILDIETGGMLEIWANLFGVTGEKAHRELMERYSRERLFRALLEGKDVLTNRHANTTVPEIHGAARAWEVTHVDRWRQIAEAYWKCAVTDRGTFCTGGQTSGEVWTPPHRFSARLGDSNQEHCLVYNMMRLADFLFRWTGEEQYADYVERNLYNGILAQQNPRTGMVAYFLPLEAGARKIWGTPTHDFWCCHGTMIQAHTVHNAYTFYQSPEGLTVCQYIPSELTWKKDDVAVKLRQVLESWPGSQDARRTYGAPESAWHRPEHWKIAIEISCEKPVSFTLSLRVPGWVSGPPVLEINGTRQDVRVGAPGYHSITRTWGKDRLTLTLPKKLAVCPIPDRPELNAVMDGPVVLAGLCGEERALRGDPADPATFLVPDNEREWWRPRGGWRTIGQDAGTRFLPLHEVVDERYTVYFPITRS